MRSVHKPVVASSSTPIVAHTNVVVSEVASRKHYYKNKSEDTPPLSPPSLLPIGSTEFQSVKLESLSAAETSKPICMDEEKSMDLNSVEHSWSSSEDDESLQTTLKQHASIFEEMKDILLSQRNSLKEQLTLLNNYNNQKMVTSALHSRSTSQNSISENLKPCNRAYSSSKSPERKPEGSLPQKTYHLRTCPLCSKEIDVTDNVSALEIHVSEHYGALVSSNGDNS